jgi:hypothetical protein
MGYGGKPIGGASNLSIGENGRLGGIGADYCRGHARTLAADWF